MFTGIIEGFAEVVSVQSEGTNKHFEFSSPFVAELKVDQSVAHNGVCLTVVKIGSGQYTVTAIEETLLKTNLGELKPGDRVNVERCLRIGDRLDGHWVLGHVDQVARCAYVKPQEGSWIFGFEYDASSGNFTVAKGSICVNGISLTVVDSTEGAFSVAIIPYTFEHTNLCEVKPGHKVNLEFDVIGKYLLKMANPYKKN
jgi:riboflavin synthase